MVRSLFPSSLLVFLLIGCGEPGDTGESGTGDSTPDADADGDGSVVGEDCDDGDATVFPGAPEVCNGDDDDCDERVDDEDDDLAGTTTFYTDEDGDGVGGGAGRSGCTAQAGETELDGDCDDTDATAFPGATEVCDGVDNDCDGLGDEDDDSLSGAATWYPDADGDGYGRDDAPLQACRKPADYARDAGDCDDDLASRNPGAAEVCGDGVDNDCDDTDNGCELEGEIDFATNPAGNVIVDDGAWGFGRYRPVGDLDGDGYAEIAVSEAGEDAVWLVHGPVSGVSKVGSAWGRIEQGRDDNNFGIAALGGFDWDGDGEGDVALSATQYARDDIGYLKIYTNTSGGGTVDGDTYAAYLEHTNGQYIGTYGLVTCDLDGDGTGNDILARAHTDSGQPVAWVAGWERGSETPALTFGLATGGFSQGGFTTADVNGDGVDDLLLGAPDFDYDEASPDGGATYIGYGPIVDITDLDDTWDLRLYSHLADDYSGRYLDMSGDGDGDGHLDLLIGGPGNSVADAAARIVRGPLASGAIYTLASTSFSISSGSEASTWVGDVDGDGQAELAITEPDSWAVYLYSAAATGTFGIADAQATFLGTRADGSSVVAGGDLDLDGRPDLLLGGLSHSLGGAPVDAVVVVGGEGL
ncbi:hypothetical protein LBMAG42_55530 [Deltaproteobacteria bacterium]|nr:hypothetical protein LBMAG42_55530 [Deltaproteobacteria bacterium]